MRKFLSEDFYFFLLSNIRFCASCTGATWRDEFVITEAGGANARPSARVSRRVGKLNCERETQPGGSDAVCARIQTAMIISAPRAFQQFKTPPDCVLPEDLRAIVRRARRC